MAEQLKVTLTPIKQSNLEQIEQQWRELEKTANNSIFIHWPFIYTWLNYIEYNGNILSVHFNNTVVGLGILTENISSKNGIRIKQLWLNRTGNEALDQIWSEYNSILCTKGLEHSIHAAIIDYFETTLTDYDELIIGVSDYHIKETPRPNNITQYTSWKSISYQTNLTKNCQQWDSFLSTLSANTRSQIKRSVKLYGGINDITLARANSKEEALEFLTKAGTFHKVRWANQNSGFNNPKFVRFHHDFISNNFHLNIIDLLKIKTGNKTIGYLYNFLYNKRVYFYLSGITYDTDNRLKPGLVAHCLAINYYAKQGYDLYDFMGGEGRYKQSLSTSSDVLIVSNFRRKTLPFIASSIIRRIKALCA